MDHKTSQHEVNVMPYETVNFDTTLSKKRFVSIEDISSTKDRMIPTFRSELHTRIIETPPEIYQASGIKIFGRRIKSFIFTTDVALIRNHNAHAVFAVYPFTPKEIIMKAIIDTASVPVFTGVGGGTTSGERSVRLAFEAEQLGAYGVVVNAPIASETITAISRLIDIPVIATISSFETDFKAKLQAGADILNVSAGARTTELVAHIRQTVGLDVPIIATGGKTGESILETIRAGANCIIYTPPTNSEITAALMKSYR
ncbi:hydrolase [Dolosicoccus paucivorans]|uniref:hydrolase n=1 Tax=Dolosicoccus paucivorans TaxID=84521 RepID=UPI001FD21CD0|nr:hydrolase [Dolosicoccus paucivorans]